jgi:hypothetical protein
LGSSDSVVEVGSIYTPSYTVSFNGGSYSYGPASTGVIPSYNVNDTRGNSSTLAADSFEPFTVEENESYKITATVNYSQGVVPVTNLGNADEESRI